MKIFAYLILGQFLASLCFAEERPNILFLITDDQFKTMMNFYPEGKGKNLTPHTDELAEAGTVLNRQYVTSPVCTPSRYSCLTGLYPSRSNSKKFHRSTTEASGQTVVQWNTFITDENTLPRRLRDAGYFTGMVGKNHVFESDDWKKPNWDSDPNDPETKQLLENNRLAQAAFAKHIGFDFAASLYYDNPSIKNLKALASHNLDWIAKGALDFVDESSKTEKPFFLYLASTVPHGPTEPAKSWDADRRITADGLLDQPLDILPSKDDLKQRLKKAKIYGPKQNILWLDDMVGAVINKLKQAGKLDNTLIVYFNDHGQKAKGSLYEGGIHSECFFWKKGGFPAGSHLNQPVSNVDFAPTLLDLAGIDYDQSEFDGNSFLPLLNGETKKKSEPLFFELGYVRGVLLDEWKYIALRYPEKVTNMPLAQRKRRLEKFNIEQKRKGRPIHNTDPEAAFSHVMLVPGGGDAEHQSLGAYPDYYDADQLYNLTNDPKEQKNLATDPEHQNKLAEMRSLLTKHLAEMPGTFADLKPE